MARQKAQADKNLARHFSKQYDRSFMASKTKKALSKSLNALAKGRQTPETEDLTSIALDRSANTFTPYKLRLIDKAKKKMDLTKLGNSTRSAVLRHSTSRHSSTASLAPSHNGPSELCQAADALDKI
jgi:hypothetical protein